MKDSSLKRVSGYSAAIAATLGVSSAEAAITFIDINPDATGTTYYTNSGVTLLSFNLAGDVATNGTHVANEQFFFNHGYYPGNPSEKFPGSVTTSKLNIGTTNGIAAFSTAQVSYGTTIGPGQAVDPNTQGTSSLSDTFKGKSGGNWLPGSRNYLALRFNNNGVANYGWADVMVSDTATITLYSFAYDDQGNPVAAGSLEPIPEPTQMALFALGAAGIAAYRRRKAIPTPGK